MPYLFRSIICVIALSAFLQSSAQPAQHITGIKHAEKLLMGQWQLVKTFSEGKFHEVKKEAFNGVITFKPDNRYSEEVWYESNHWIIEGKWMVNKSNTTLALTGRHYITGTQGKAPEDFILQLSELTDTAWTGEGTDKGQPIKMYYQKIR